uniref:Replication protein A C-terminal domain-containing protein n=1 Tax=Otolemur garnettii TaxID=30611 RepID=H0XVG4_OTOGA
LWDQMSKRGLESCGSLSAKGGAGGGSDPPCEGSAGPARKTRRPQLEMQKVIPCCVNQLLSATLVDNVFKVREVVVSQVVIVGIIRQADRAPNGILYKIDDMTSKPIEAQHWLGRDEAEQTTPLPIGVFGVLQGSAQARRLEILRILLVKNMSALTINILDTANAHMILWKAAQN